MQCKVTPGNCRINSREVQVNSKEIQINSREIHLETGKLETDQVECPNDEDPSFEGAAAAAVLNGAAVHPRAKGCRSEKVKTKENAGEDFQVPPPRYIISYFVLVRATFRRQDRRPWTDGGVGPLQPREGRLISNVSCI